MTLPNINHGILIISLDFELYWGVRDKRHVSDYSQQLKAVHDIVPRLLTLFKKYDIHASWATVGLLFAHDKNEALSETPLLKPTYNEPKLNPYHEFDNDLLESPYYFAPSLIEQIKKTPHQEIASHTFSHYYCLEEGQTPDQFNADLMAAQSIAKKHTKLQSLVFPRNQYNQTYLDTAADCGFKTFRGNERSIIHRPRNQQQLSLAIRGTRLLDSYLPLSGHNTYDLPPTSILPINLASSCFYRSYSHRLRHFEWLKHKRIHSSLKFAAKHHKIYHLWWHPHNFGQHMDKNFSQLESLFKYFRELQQSYGMTSMNMGEMYKQYYENTQTGN